MVRHIGNGLEDSTLHCLRHSWASKALRHGVPLDYVRRILGHSSQWMSERYGHVAAPELKQALELVGESIAGQEDDDA